MASDRTPLIQSVPKDLSPRGRALRMQRPLLLRRIALALLLLSAAAWREAGAASHATQAPESEEFKLARRVADLIMDGDLEAAVGTAREIQRLDPQSPLGYLFEADATWWRIYYATGNLIDPDVFDVAPSETTPYDAHLEDLVNTAISKSEERIRAHPEEARNYLYEGLAYAVRARFVGLRGKDLPTARAGKKMRALLLTALRLDPNLTDAYLGMGIYNYFVDTLPAIIKLLRFFIALPGGNRELGLEQLQKAGQNGVLTRGEAKFYLAKNYSRQNEREYSKSLEIFQAIAQEYPHNPLWSFIAGSLRCRLGRTQECDAVYRETFRKTAGEKAEVRQALHRAAQQALQRMHPDEKFGE